MHLIAYPDVMYKVANDAILIQTRCVQSLVSLEKKAFRDLGKIMKVNLPADLLHWGFPTLFCLFFFYFFLFLDSFEIYRAFQSVVFNSGQKMALRAFYFIRALTKALTYYYINRSQRHLLAAIENN